MYAFNHDLFFEGKGRVHFVPRVTLNTENDPPLPFTFSRHQFPVRVAYGMTINKSQGQTFQNVGIFLPEPCFRHGQLYTAASRVTSSQGLKVQIFPGPKQGKV